MKRNIIIDDALYIEPVTACNLRCKCCYSNYDTLQNNKIIPFDVIFNFVQEYAELVFNPNITWCGRGEIFLYPRFLELINKINNEFPRISNLIQTNATVHLAGEFEQIQKLDFSISIDGFAKAHNQNRGKDTFAKAFNFALNVYQKGARSVCIRAIVNKLNIFDFKDFEEEIKIKIGEKAFLILTVPYSKKELIYAENAKVMRQNFDDTLLFEQKEAIKILQENYDKEFLQKVCPDIEKDRSKANIYTYLSLMPEGVFSCCEGQKKIADYPINAEKAFEILKTSGKNLCENCRFANVCMLG